MKKLTNISNDPIQTFTLIIGQEEAIISLRFYPAIQQWYFDLTFREQKTSAVKLSLGVLHINSRNYPFDFIIKDTSGLGIDPFQIDDFEIGRIELFLLTAEEIADYRGYNVKV